MTDRKQNPIELSQSSIAGQWGQGKLRVVHVEVWEILVTGMNIDQVLQKFGTWIDRGKNKGGGRGREEETRKETVQSRSLTSAGVPRKCRKTGKQL